MRFTVVWLEPPTNDLAIMWMAAPDQQSVADAADAIDRMLRTAPDKAAPSFGAFHRLRVEPLEVDYVVSPPDCLVTVTAVRRVP